MIKIKECGEPMVDVKKLCPDLIVQKTAYLRKTVVEMVYRAKKYLPRDMTFIIENAWRPQCVQEKIFQDFAKRFGFKEARKYVAPCKGKHVSGHMTGGVVDLRLWKNNKKVPMKSSKLTYRENAKSFQPKLPDYIQKKEKLCLTLCKKPVYPIFQKNSGTGHTATFIGQKETKRKWLFTAL